MDYGFVGDVDAVNTDLISSLLEKNIAIVFAPITHDQQGQLLNTNADTIAKELAKAMSDHFEVILVFSFEKNGVLMNTNDANSVIKNISPSYYKELRKKEIINAGMIPKLDNAFAALDAGVSKVIIGNAEELSKLVEGRAGTAIRNE